MKRLTSIDGPTLVQATGVSVLRREPLTVEAVVACLEENADRILQGIGVDGVEVPVLAIGAQQIARRGSEFQAAGLREAFDELVPIPGPPPAYVPSS
jgi:hypothetical protein